MTRSAEALSLFIPKQRLEQIRNREFSLYIHVPFCVVRCGYCDFNTYALGELGTDSVKSYLYAAHQELDLAKQNLGGTPALSTIFFGGGTPTLLAPNEIASLIAHARDLFGFTQDIEITTEANPETITTQVLEGLIDAGVNRLSLGMQSADEKVLAILNRVHTPGKALTAVRLARQLGLENVSLDLIYGTPGETKMQWRNTLEAALSVEPSHVSAYSLIVEQGTALARKIKRGELANTDDDDLADKYLITEQLLTESGLANYEISNWARTKNLRARHNMAYWLGHNWWGIGPGAHSHIEGVRWWNEKLPRNYAAKLAELKLPIKDYEILDSSTRREERVMLELRLADGLPLDVLSASEKSRLTNLIDADLVQINAQRACLTLAGRLLADGITTDLLD